MPLFTPDLFADQTVGSAPDWQDRLALWYVVNQSLSTYDGVLAHFGSAGHALQVPCAEWERLGVHASHLKRFKHWLTGSVERTRFEQSLTDLAQQRYHVIQPHDDSYPKRLRELVDAPPFLFVRGALEALQRPQIAIVGTRQPTPSGRQLAREFAAALAAQGLWVTSGLARGVDAEAHLGALSVGGGRTLAVLGTGLDVCYPRQHQPLYDQIVAEGGAVISEFFADAQPVAHHFPRRNRIVSGLSLGVLVVEAARKSGSQITARLAAEQGRLVFAIPSHVKNEQARGCHDLIREGAILVDDPSQVLEDLELPRQWHEQAAASVRVGGVAVPEVRPVVDVPVHLQPVLAHVDWIGLDMDQLVDSTALDVAVLSGLLMELELLGLVLQVGGRYQRCLA
ncbi:MAG: DNA-protecting protein DprA [Pseudomonadota bacterium]|jgi:DNA processing protein